MDRTVRRVVVTAPVVALAAATAGCGGTTTGPDDGAGATPDYDSRLEAPARSAFSDGSDTSPDAENGRVELALDSGTRVVIWIDPDHIARVYEQHSDPDAGSDDAERWTEPHLLYTAGDGCLITEAVTDGVLVAATLGCYESDAFIQQAPDHGQAVVTADLVDWDVEDGGELYEEPEIAADGDTVSWPDGPTWTRDDGFE